MIKANPDSPQTHARRIALEEGKTVIMAVPRLRDPHPFRVLDLKQLSKSGGERGGDDQGRPQARPRGRPRRLPEIDFVLCGSVAELLPSFLMPPSDRPSRMRTLGSMARMCIAAEFGALERGGSTPVAGWLRALARKEAAAAGQAAGVIGMCFSGGFALGTAIEPQVAAAVMSQPALPFLYGDDLGMPDKDLRRLKTQVGTGGCLRVLRYERDRISRRTRFDRLVTEFPDISHVQIPTSDRSKHSVLRDGLTAPAGSDLRIALDETLDFLAARLAPAARP